MPFWAWYCGAMIVLFYLFAAVVVGGAGVCCFARKLNHAAMGLMAVMGGTAGFYFLMQAEFLAAVQLAVVMGTMIGTVLVGIVMTRKKANAGKPSKYQEFYTPDTYRKAVLRAIQRANRQLQEGEKIPHWFPYQLRHSTATALTKVLGKALAQAQAQLGLSFYTSFFAHFAKIAVHVDTADQTCGCSAQ